MPSRSLLALVTALLLLLAGAWWWLRPRAESAIVAPAAHAAAPAEEGPSARLEAGNTSAREHAPKAEPASQPAAAPAAAEVASPAAASPPLPPKDAVGELVLRIVEQKSGRPIPDAKVRLYALRRSDEPGSSYGWPESAPAEATSDGFGIARLSYPAWVRGLGTTSSVSYFVSHAEYPSKQDEIEIKSLRTEATIELVLGCYLVVSGWIGTPGNAVQAVSPMLEFEAGIASTDWIAGRDGRIGTNRIKPGEHALYLDWVSPEGRRHASRVVEFTLAEGEQREMALELLPPVTLHGRLDDAVPRPVIHGEVQLNAVFGKQGATAGLRLHKATIESDGTFTLPDLQPGRIELIALCDGWAATYGLEAYRHEYTVPGEEQKRVEEGETWSIPSFEVSSEQVLVVPMTPTAAVELELVDEQGVPLEGASFVMFPNVHWPSSGYAQIYLERKWSTKSDGAGRARLENLPAHAPPCEESYRVSLNGWEPVAGGRDGSAFGRIAIEPGGTARLRVVLRRK
jgi:hypothetical protein